MAARSTLRCSSGSPRRARRKREVRLAGKNLERYFRVDFYHDGNGSIKSLQRDVIAGRWDDWMLSSVALAWMAAVLGGL